MRILAVNDLSCVGKCSLTVALPVISACGATCDVLPTAVLSTHTGGFTDYTFKDMTDDFPAILSQWKNLGLKYDIIYSGYLGDIKQIELVKSLKRDFLKDDGLFIVDPVMGDNGKLYARFDDAFVKAMKGLCDVADYILPNLTEAGYLAGIAPEDENATAIFDVLKKTTSPVLTGVKENGNLSIYYYSNGKKISYSHPEIEGNYHGSGDVFASAFVGCLSAGKSLDESVKLSADFTYRSILRKKEVGGEARYGLEFEKEIFSLLKSL